MKAAQTKSLTSVGRGLLALGGIAGLMALASCCHTPDKTIDVTRYCVIDLSPGPSAASYPVSYLPDVPFWGWPDEYKTSKLVMRKIMPNSFTMGGHYASGNWPHKVTLTNPFYCGVFEVTQKQYELVMGTNPSHFKGEAKPVDNVSWDVIRGKSSTYNWPTSNAVDPDSFMGRLRMRTGLNFDLPTEAQWECACRAGTMTIYYWGNRMNDRYCWYMANSKESTHNVGQKKPNRWGLYDMSGNVLEWCLDWHANIVKDQLPSETIDPVGPSKGEERIRRGGFWNCSEDLGCSSDRYSFYSHFSDSQDGFRAAITLPRRQP